jgi:hypothetical protein
MQRFLVYTFGIVGVLIFASAMISYQWLRSAGPRQVEAASGHIYPMRMQQPFDVYLTKCETRFIEAGPGIGCALGFLAAVLNIRWKVIRNPYEEIPKKFY